MGAARTLTARSGATMRRTIAAIVMVALAGFGLTLVAPPAHAVVDGLTGFEVGITFDGTSDGVAAGDASITNGVVATNDVVGFEWQGTFLNAGETITFTQTLPAGWAWDESVLELTTRSGGDGLYSSTSSLSADGLTLTVMVTPEADDLFVKVSGLPAVPSSDAVDTTYTATVTAADAASGTETASAAELSVIGASLVEMGKNLNGGRYNYTLDGVAGVAQRFDINIRIPDANANAAGVGQDGSTTLTAPVVINDSWDGPASTVYEVAVLLNGTWVTVEDYVTWTQTGNSLELTYIGEDLGLDDTLRILYRVHWADEVIPGGGSATPVTNTIAPGSGWDTTPTERTTNGYRGWSATFNLLPRSGTGAAMNKYLYVPTTGDSPTSLEGVLSSDGWQQINRRGADAVPSGSLVVARIQTTLGLDADGELEQYTGAVVSDTWDPAEQQLDTSIPIWVGDADGTEVPTTDYTVEYQLSDATWTTTMPGAGVSEVYGVRVTLNEQYPGAYTTSRLLNVLVPVTPVVSLADNIRDNSAFDGGNVEDTASNWATYDVASAELEVTKDALDSAGGEDISATVSGNTVYYDIHVAVYSPSGSDTALVTNLTVTDLLPANTATFTVDDGDGFWSVTAAEDPNGSGRTLMTFTHAAGVSDTDTIPNIGIAVTTSVQAPSNGQMANTATVTADDTVADAEAETIGVSQTQVRTLTKFAPIPVIEVGDETATWNVSWFNFLEDTEGLSYIVDVLPYDGDAAGSSFSGTAVLSSVELTAAEAVGATLEYTTDDPATVAATPANDPADAVEWSALADPSNPPAGVTAIRVVLADFVSGEDGTGNLRVVMDVVDQAAGDVYVNSAFGYIGVSQAEFALVDDDVEVVGSSIAGHVVLDTDPIGSYEATETSLPATVVVNLLQDGSVVATDEVIGEDGAFLFDELHSGDYEIVIDDSTLPAGTVATFDYSGDVDRASGTIALGQGEDITGVDFGEAFLATLEGRVVIDADESGSYQASDAGLAGVSVQLIEDGSVVASAFTGADGGYLFEGIEPGDYTVAVDADTLSSSYVSTFDPSGDTDRVSGTYTIAYNDVVTDVHFGEFYDGPSSIAGRVVLDADEAGDYDATDEGIAGVTVQLVVDTPEGVIEETTTDVTGAYEFDELERGDYQVVIDPAGVSTYYEPTFDVDGGVDRTVTVSLPAATQVTEQNFAEFYNGPSSVSGLVLLDLDELGELLDHLPGIAGVEVSLYDADDQLVGQASTLDDGSFEFTDLPRGDYYAVINPLVVSEHFEATFDAFGAIDRRVSFSLPANTELTGIDFLEFLNGPATVSGTVVIDVDRGGDLDAGDTGIAGVTVRLIHVLTGVEADAVETDAQGRYLFEGVARGAYTVAVDASTLPEDTTASFDPSGDLDRASAGFVVLANSEVTDLDFGELLPILPGEMPSTGVTGVAWMAGVAAGLVAAGALLLRRRDEPTPGHSR